MYRLQHFTDARIGCCGKQSASITGTLGVVADSQRKHGISELVQQYLAAILARINNVHHHGRQLLECASCILRSLDETGRQCVVERMIGGAEKSHFAADQARPSSIFRVRLPIDAQSMWITLRKQDQISGLQLHGVLQRGTFDFALSNADKMEQPAVIPWSIEEPRATTVQLGDHRDS